jgi:nitroreductase
VHHPIQPLPPSSPTNKSEILYGIENAVGRGVYFMSNVKERMDIFFDHRAPSIVVDIEEYRNGYIEMRRRGAKIRAFTEITKDNFHYCKELMKLVDELRHLDGVRGGMARKNFEFNEKPSITHQLDAGAAWENLALEACFRGLVTHGMEGFDYQRARQELGIPENYDVMAMIAIGKRGSKENLPPKLRDMEFPNNRKPLNEIVMEGKFRS